jgi:hypothetical protein
MKNRGQDCAEINILAVDAQVRFSWIMLDVSRALPTSC